ncbi:MAG: hypothetical protein IPJ65_07520 [Archangiaceae bacterium]|nr:hypothetical protein [Archangiaceae bacterium]
MLAPVIAKQLKQLGYGGTVAELKRFQSERGIRPSGVVDAQTRITLERAVRLAQESRRDQFVARVPPPPARLSVPAPGEHVIDERLADAIAEFKRQNPKVEHDLSRWAGRPVVKRTA